VFQAIIGGKSIDTASVMSYSVLLLGCALGSNSHVLSNVVSVVSKNIVSLAASTCMQST
jgi:hypothetical protein